MRFKLPIIALAMAAASPAAAAGQGTPEAKQEQAWLRSGDSVVLIKARIAFPASPAGLDLVGSTEFSHPGESLDAAVEYRSPDKAIVATAYLYYPGLAHSGIAALATDHAIRSASSSPVRGGELRKVAAAGAPDAALRAEYSNYKNGHVSSAAFLKAGRWLVKLRVTGPEDRKSEVDATMAALLSGTKVGRGVTVHPARPVTVMPCVAGEGGKEARMLPDPPSAVIAAHAFLGTFDGGGIEAAEGTSGEVSILGSRVPDTFCRSVGIAPVPMLRSAPAKPGSIDGRTRLIVLLGDGGGVLELVDAPNLRRHLLLLHEIGRTAILSGWDGVPSDAQIAAILAGTDTQAGRTRAAVQLRPDKGAEIRLPPPSEPVPRS